MERLEDLQLDNLYIYQRSDLYKFTSDAVILSDFAKVKKSDFVVDFGTGSGILPLLIYGKYRPKAIAGIEIQKEMAEMAEKSVEYNNLNDIICIIKGKIQSAHKLLSKHPDVVVCNPPYRKLSQGQAPKNDCEKIAKFETMISLPEIMESARRNLKIGGRLFMIHSSDRFSEIVAEALRNDISIRRVRFIYAKKNSLAHLVLIEGRNGGKSEMKVLPPLILKNDDNTDSEEIEKIYNRGKKNV